MATNRYERITASDGGGFDAYCAIPDSGSGPGLVVFQEIFGINDNIRELSDRFADAGYVVLAPDMFWRLEPRFERKDESGIGDAFAMVQNFDMAQGIDDIGATHAHLLGMAACTGKVGGVGFCLGGGLAFAMAALSRVDGRGPDGVVSYYGSAVNSLLEHADKIECPILFHYGDSDAFIPTENVTEVENAFAGNGAVEVLHYDAGHAFSNFDAPSMYNAEAAALSWERTLAFLERTLR